MKIAIIALLVSSTMALFPPRHPTTVTQWGTGRTNLATNDVINSTVGGVFVLDFDENSSSGYYWMASVPSCIREVGSNIIPYGNYNGPYIRRVAYTPVHACSDYLIIQRRAPNGVPVEVRTYMLNVLR